MKVSLLAIDSASGKPAANLPATLERHAGAGKWEEYGTAMTDEKGRISQMLAKGSDMKASRFRMTIQTASFFESRGHRGLYPYITVIFEVDEPLHDTAFSVFIGAYGYSVHRCEG